MLCPICPETQLLMSNRQNVEIDYCPKCRGVWLDRGELDKIIEGSQREFDSTQSVSSPAVNNQQPPVDPSYYQRSDSQGRGHDSSSGHGKSRHGASRGSFLRNLFD